MINKIKNGTLQRKEVFTDSTSLCIGSSHLTVLRNLPKRLDGYITYTDYGKFWRKL